MAANNDREIPDLSFASVLVVDDFPSNLVVASGMMKKYKMRVDCVSGGQEALDRIKAGEPLYSAIFMDHLMPDMDGMETTRQIRSLGTDYAKNIPIIAMTGNDEAKDENMFLQNGFQAFMPKPLSVAALNAVIVKWIRKPGEAN